MAECIRTAANAAALAAAAALPALPLRNLSPDPWSRAGIPPSQSSPHACRTESCSRKCPSTASVSSTSNTWPIRDLYRHPGRRGPTSGSTSSRQFPETIAGPIVSAAHAYQVGAARDEFAGIPRQSGSAQARAEPAGRLHRRRGLRSRRCRGLHDAGVLVVNQSGGNAKSVAEHALGMMLTLSKRILQADRALREANATATADRQRGASKTIGIVGLGNVGRRIAKLCNDLLRMKVLAYDPTDRRKDRRARRQQGRARRTAATRGFRLDLLSTERTTAHDRHARIRADAAARLFHHHRARLHSRREGADEALRDKRMPAPA